MLHIPVTERSLLTALGEEHPEWRPLLVLIEGALREVEDPQWARFVPALEPRERGVRPLLDGVVINVAPRSIGRWVRQVLSLAASAGTDVEPFGKAVAAGWLDPLLLFETAISRNVAHCHQDRGLLRAMAPLIAMPMLQACRRAWGARVPTDWASGYCPICGGWPALAEIRGLDGTRHLRCGCCGSDWRTESLRCPFCGERDHRQLSSFVSPDCPERQAIDVCDGCDGYVKTITTLAAVRPEEVVLQDLATLALDVAAIERGYRRPAAKGYDVAVSVSAPRSRLRGLFGLGA